MEAFDRIVIAMAPTSSAPAWFYGIFLILLFAALLGWLPFGGMIDAPPRPPGRASEGPEYCQAYDSATARLGDQFDFSTSYSWRTFF